MALDVQVQCLMSHTHNCDFLTVCGDCSSFQCMWMFSFLTNSAYTQFLNCHRGGKHPLSETESFWEWALEDSHGQYWQLLYLKYQRYDQSIEFFSKWLCAMLQVCVPLNQQKLFWMGAWSYWWWQPTGLYPRDQNLDQHWKFRKPCFQKCRPWHCGLFQLCDGRSHIVSVLLALNWGVQ